MLAFNASCSPFLFPFVSLDNGRKALNFIIEDCLLLLITFNKIFINPNR